MNVPEQQSTAGRLEIGKATIRVKQHARDRNLAGLFIALDSPLERGHLSVAGDAAQALVAIGYEGALARITPLLDRDSRAVRFGALLAIEELGSDQAVAAVEAKLSDREPLIRLTAARVLAQLTANPASRGLLLRLASDDPDDSVRLAAARALVGLRDDRVREVIAARVDQAGPIGQVTSRRVRSWRGLLKELRG